MAIVTIDIQNLDDSSIEFFAGNAYSLLIFAGRVDGLIPNQIKKHLEELYFQCLEECKKRGIDIESKIAKSSNLLDAMTDFGSDIIGFVNEGDNDDE
jgi:hypothetical protein